MVRRTPLVAQILFVYFAPPSLLLGLQFSGYGSAVVALAINIGTCNAEVIRASIQAESFQPVPVFITVAAIYLLLTSFVTAFSRTLERRLGRDRPRPVSG